MTTPTPTPPPVPHMTLVTDLMFDAKAEFDQTSLVAALTDAFGGEETLGTKQLVDADMLDPRQEMQISPSMPFRRRGERRLMILDEGLPVPAVDPQESGVIGIDLRLHRDALIKICHALPVRMGRLFILGGFGDAVLVAHSAIDLRAISLLPWVLDPQVDVDGKRRAGRLSQQEFEAKLVAYEKRLDELDELAILTRLSGATFTRAGELMIVDNLEADGTWDSKKSLVTEAQLAAVDRFSMLPGAPSQPAIASATPAARAAAPTTPTPPVAPPAPKGPALRTVELGTQLVLVFPDGRFDLDVASALGKRDWDSVVRSSDPVNGSQRDRMHQHGAAWIAPLEFLSEVFVDGKPLTKTGFEQDAQPIGDGVRSLAVHFPRFGPVTLLDIAGVGRFVTSLADHHTDVARLVHA